MTMDFTLSINTTSDAMDLVKALNEKNMKHEISEPDGTKQEIQIWFDDPKELIWLGVTFAKYSGITKLYSLHIQ